MNILVVRNSENAPEGAFGDWLRAQGHALTVTHGWELTQREVEAAEVLLLLGSPYGVYDTQIPWIPAQRDWVAARLTRQQPTIGICFGAQLMAAAVGGDSRRMADGRYFRGWFGMDSAADPVLAGPWPRWHGDTITVPPGATVLAEDAGTVQAIALPRAIGVQFHPEATPDILQVWAEKFSPAGAVDAAALAAESARLFPARRPAREALFAWLLKRATGA